MKYQRRLSRSGAQASRQGKYIPSSENRPPKLLSFIPPHPLPEAQFSAMSMSVSFLALAPKPRVALATAPGARRRAPAKHAPPRRGDALTRTASRKRRKNKGGSIGDVDAFVKDTAEASAPDDPVAASPSLALGLPNAPTTAKKTSPARARPNPDASGTSTTTPSEPLPVASRDDVLDSCYGTTFWLLAIGVVLREGAHFGQGKLPSAISDWTSDLPLIAALHPPSSPQLIAGHAIVALACAAAVAAGRRALVSVSPEFREATNRSNAQVLRPLSPGDVVTVSVLPAVAEETVFRGVLLPALSSVPAWGAAGAVAVSGLVFGALHVGGGRNASFAAWASAVGVLYGAAAVYTGDVATAMLAHGLANYASAYSWLKEDNGS